MRKEFLDWNDKSQLIAEHERMKEAILVVLKNENLPTDQKIICKNLLEERMQELDHAIKQLEELEKWR